MLECPMRMSYDSEANAAYLTIDEDIPNGSVTENFRGPPANRVPHLSGQNIQRGRSAAE
ncbi:hypothetical protein Ait01nite_067670 [Actinoplanes italicus]|uniref:DUF2283 domain-containing protein n=1 Tax=Actinoplanes italicus TaxID=113567 RepID=A0A2T0K144_9ACTN|nr:hypothetical protein CLV67_11998 [Actinoplanes italicus]GIE33722.1 hypothetical protein Ait01nite_067670 [Actinoplanes italicus]